VPGLPEVDINATASLLAGEYGLIVSLHCRQIFGAEVLEKLRCVNVHPGLNPHNRGWYPHVFSIINGEKAGVTIHEMDERLDHGPIIVQQECPIFRWDTSGSVYGRLLHLEKELLLEHFPAIRDGNYSAASPHEDGNVNTRKDYEDLRRLHLEEMSTYGEVLDRLRALTHGEYKNAFFLDDDGKRVYVRVLLERE
jgi:methionyl-tRNA formyltransferase